MTAAIAAPPAPMPLPLPMPVPVRMPLPGRPGWATAVDRWRALPPAARVALLGLGVVLLLLLVPRGGGGDAADVAPVPDTPSTAALEDEFAPLYRDAAERLAEQGDAQDP
jgi:hypothetical protein